MADGKGPKPSNEEKLKTAFEKAVGSDYAALVDAVNVARRTVLTSNGGKYQILKGGNIRVLQGPNPPVA